MQPTRSLRFYLLVLIGAYGLWLALFLPLGHFAATLDTFDIRTAFDRALPVIPEAVWIYDLCYFMPIFAVFTLLDGHRLNRLLVSIYVATAAAAVVYLTIPISYPVPEFGSSLSERFLDWQFRIDFQPGANKMPSLHVANALMVWLAVRTRGRRTSALYLTLAILIAISTLLVKKHLILDVAVGAVWAAGAWWAAGRIYNRLFDQSLSGEKALLKRLGFGNRG